jgi:hypothetical protein
MNHRHPVSFVAVFLAFSCYNGAYAQEDLRIWRDFVGTLKAGKMTVDRIRPLTQLGDKYKPILLGFLDSVRTQASPADWEAQPEIIRVEDRIQYIVPWTANNQKVTYCFSMLSDSTQWYFQHLETIFIRLDTVSKFPASGFPDVPEGMKIWAREEIYWSFVILNVYLPVARDRGKEAALNMLRDGAGYFVGAQTWVPFSPPHTAFVLYLCWEQANLRGNQVTLLKLQDNESIVRLNTHFFALYFVAAHLKPVISLDDYKEIFETIWQDRASNAGWQLSIEYSADHQATFHLTRNP